MVQVDPAVADEYRAAWKSWHRQLETLHGVFLEGQAMLPPRLKGLLNREARAKERYDVARERLLGISAGPDASRIS